MIDLFIKNIDLVGIASLILSLYMFFKKGRLYWRGGSYCQSLKPEGNKIAMSFCNPSNNSTLVLSLEISPYRFNHWRGFFEYENKRKKLGKNIKYYINPKDKFKSEDFSIPAQSIETFETEITSNPDNSLFKIWKTEFEKKRYFYITILYGNGRKRVEKIKNPTYSGIKNIDCVKSQCKYCLGKTMNKLMDIKTFISEKAYSLAAWTISLRVVDIRKK